jgi:hypothetical protein
VVVAAGALTLAAGALIGLPVVLLGAAVMVGGIYGWAFEPIHG